VLEVAPSAGLVAFRIETVLLPGHEAFAHPRQGEMYCFRSWWLTIASEHLTADLSGAPPAVDATRARDLGHIDRFEQIENGVWALDGEWGTAMAVTPSVDLVLD